jgi:hypothetical protein
VKKAKLCLVLLMLLMGSTPALADGGFYWSESIPPEIPYQRALLFFDGDRETLIVQSKYLTSRSTTGALGWVVPVPAVPELASVDLELAEAWFDVAGERSSPEVMRISRDLPPRLALLLNGVAALTLVCCVLSLFVPRMRYVRRHLPALAAGAVLLLLPLLSVLAVAVADSLDHRSSVLLVGPILAVLALLVCKFPPSFTPWLHTRGDRVILAVYALLSLPVAWYLVTSAQGRASSPGFADAPVEVIKAEQVGIYDVQVIRADQAGSLVGWLNEKGLRFRESDGEVFADYMQRGWCFVVAQVNAARDTQESKVGLEGLVAPLVMRFEADAPVYPLALTSTAGESTQIVLYLISQHKWTAQGRLELHYAGSVGNPARYLLTDEQGSDLHIEPPGFFTDEERALPYLCKFKGTLNPKQMREDLVFAPAEDDLPYRKRIIIW